MPFVPERATVAELFRTYQAVLGELRARGIIRTANAPAGDYAEYLVARALSAELEPNSNRSYDLKTVNGQRIQVKCRVRDQSSMNPRQQLSPFRTFDFDQAAIVLLGPDYLVERAVLIPCEVVKANATYRQHVNGYVAHARPSLLDHPTNTDITERVRQAAAT
jgi:hypothetical protein